jgi:hypothetical protein
MAAVPVSSLPSWCATVWQLVELEIAAVLGANRHERTE